MITSNYAGRYKFYRIPFGISSPQDFFSGHHSDMLEDIEVVEVIVDNLLKWGETEVQCDKRLRKVLNMLINKNPKLNKDKSQI